MLTLLRLSRIVILAVFLIGCQFLRDALAPGFEVRTIERRRTEGGVGVGKVAVPNTLVRGNHMSDLSVGGFAVTGNTRSYGWVRTDRSGRYKVSKGRTPATWNTWYDCGFGAVFNRVEVALPAGTIEHDCPSIFLPGFSSSRFEIAGSEPSTLTLGGSGLRSQYGMPMLDVYDRYGRVIRTLSATSVSSDGSVAIFPFPRTTQGGSLPSDIHGMTVLNWDTSTQVFCEPMYDEWGFYIGDYCWEEPGQLRYAGANYLAIGTATSYAGAPFGWMPPRFPYMVRIVRTCPTMVNTARIGATKMFIRS